MIFFRFFTYVWLLSILFIFSCQKPDHCALLVKVKLDETSLGETVRGKLIFLFDKDTSAQLVYGVDPNRLQPVYTYNICDWNPKDTIYISKFDDEWLTAISDLEGEYAYRVIFDADTLKRSSFVVQGNSYSRKQKQTFTSGQKVELEVAVNNQFEGWCFNATANIKEVRYQSELLSDFWGREMCIEAAVVLPSEYFANQNKKYPVVYVFPGFGSSHAAITYGDGQINRYGINKVGAAKIFVFCNGEFFQGYHHFADSDNNGPWGKAFTQEFIPFVENQWRVLPGAQSRFLMGQSSGAWTSVWLQVSYPNLFNGAFAASPDPLDFRTMGACNIYKQEANFYYADKSDSTDLLKGEKTRLLVELEHVVDEYGQVRTWEASFSPKSEGGTPAYLFDRATGIINHKVASHWKHYDIGLKLSNYCEAYQDALAGKLHLFVSRDDDFGLDASVELVDEILRDHDIKAHVQYFEDLGHNVWTDELRTFIHHEIDNQVLKQY